MRKNHCIVNCFTIILRQQQHSNLQRFAAGFFTAKPFFLKHTVPVILTGGEGGIIDGNSSAVNVTVEGWHQKIQFSL